MSVATTSPTRNENRTMIEQGTGQLAKIERTPPVITTADEYRTNVQQWSTKQMHVLTPFADISGLAAHHGILTTVVQMNPDIAPGNDVYGNVPWLKKDERALAKNGLRRIAEGLGISTRLEYIAVGTVKHYWHVKAIASYRGIDGSTVTREASMEWDLREGSDRMKGWTEAQKQEGRKHGLRACETRAINAAIRECGCGIKQAYKVEEIARPFVAVRVMYQPDMSDPETRKQVTEHALRGTSALYGGSALPAASHTGDAFGEDDQPEPRHVGRGTTAPAAPEPPAGKREESAQPKADDPPHEYAVKVTEVNEVKGSSGRGPWTRFDILDSKGGKRSTFDTKLAEAARRFRDENAWVEIDEEQNGQYTNLTQIQPAAPRLPLDGGGKY